MPTPTPTLVRTHLADADPADAEADWFHQSDPNSNPPIRMPYPPPFPAALLPRDYRAVAPPPPPAATQNTPADAAMVLDMGTISSDGESVVAEVIAPPPTTSTTWPPRAPATIAASKQTPSEKSRQTSSQPPAATRIPPPSAPMSSSLPTGLLAPAARSGPASLPACVARTLVAPATAVTSLPAATAVTPVPSAATPYPLGSVVRRSRIGPMLETSSPTPQTPSAAPPLSADLARVSLQVTPVVPTVPAASFPASAGPQAGGLVCATLTAPQVTVYASSAPPPPSADSPPILPEPLPS